jgi:hypothetical protein
MADDIATAQNGGIGDTGLVHESAMRHRVEMSSSPIHSITTIVVVKFMDDKAPVSIVLYLILFMYSIVVCVTWRCCRFACCCCWFGYRKNRMLLGSSVGTLR